MSGNIKSKETKIFTVVFFVFSVILILSGCEVPSQPQNETTSGFQAADSTDDGYNWFEFYSNDPNDYQKAFMHSIEGSDQSVFSSSEILVKKESGYEYSDYGMIFCSTDNSYLALVIDTQQNYRVFKSVDGIITQLIDWSYSDELTAGYDAVNKLKVVQSSNTNFDVFLNDQLVSSFNEINLLSGTTGYFAYVASENYENLSEDPVDIYYTDKN